MPVHEHVGRKEILEQHTQERLYSVSSTDLLLHHKLAVILYENKKSAGLEFEEDTLNGMLSKPSFINIKGLKKEALEAILDIHDANPDKDVFITRQGRRRVANQP